MKEPEYECNVSLKQLACVTRYFFARCCSQALTESPVLSLRRRAEVLYLTRAEILQHNLLFSAQKKYYSSRTKNNFVTDRYDARSRDLSRLRFDFLEFHFVLL